MYGVFNIWNSIFFFPCFYAIRDCIEGKVFCSLPIFCHIGEHWTVACFHKRSLLLHAVTKSSCNLVFAKHIWRRQCFTFKNKATLKCAKQNITWQNLNIFKKFEFENIKSYNLFYWQMQKSHLEKFLLLCHNLQWKPPTPFWSCVRSQKTTRLIHFLAYTVN